MSTWTDEELETLLRATFGSREPLADPDVATRLGASTAHRRRRWVLPAAAATVVLLAIASWTAVQYRSLDPDGDLGLAHIDPLPVAGTYAAHREAARAEAARLLTLVSLPDGATRLDGEPPGGSVGQESVGPSDPDLTQTAWWTVLGSPEQVETHLREHVPDGFTTTDVAPQGTSIDGYYSVTLTQTVSPEPAAYRPAFLLLRWKALGEGTVVRADAFIGAYDVRDPRSLLAGDITSVELVGTNNPGAVPVHLSTPHDQAAITRLVDAFQALPGSLRPRPVVSCPPPTTRGGDDADTITFHEADGGTVVARLTPYCFGQVRVHRDGTQLEPTLDPGELDAVVSELLGEER